MSAPGQAQRQVRLHPPTPASAGAALHCGKLKAYYISPDSTPSCRALIRSRAVQVSSAALELFAFGQREAASRGLLLVDTKYEFGKAADGTILLIDEVRPGRLLSAIDGQYQKW